MDVAVIGAGAWGKNVVKNLYQLGALAAIVEADQETREALTYAYPGIDIYADYQEMLKRNYAAVAIATPAPTHYELAKEVLASGKDLFIEKPMALSLREGYELVQLAKNTDRVLMVGHLLLYQPAITMIKENLESGLIGDVYSFHQERLNLGRARATENALWSLGVHDVAVLLYLVGDTPDKVTFVGQGCINPSVEDDAYLHMYFPEDIQAHLHVSWLWPERKRQLTVVGSDGMLVYDELKQTVTLHHKQITKDLVIHDEGSEVLVPGDDQPLLRELAHFIECVETRQEPLSDGMSGLEVIRVLEKAKR